MAVITDALQALSDWLDDPGGVRSWAYLPDLFVPPGFVVGQPSLAFEVPERAFCWAALDVPVFVAVSRTSDRGRQYQLIDLVEGATTRLRTDQTLGGAVVNARALSATPQQVVIGDQSLPAYQLVIRLLV